MELSLQISSSSTLKRKSAASEYKWIGGENDCLLLHDGSKASFIDVSTGKPKKKSFPELKHLLTDCIYVDTFSNGTVVACLKQSGDLFLFRTESETIETIESNSDLAELIKDGPTSLHVFVDHSVNHVVIAVDFCEIFVWSRNSPHGIWYKVRWSPDVPLPDPKDNPEAVIASGSYEDEHLDRFVCLSFAFIDGQRLYFPTVVLRENFPCSVATRSKLVAVWACPSFDLPCGPRQPRRGELCAAFSPARPLLAAAFNAKRPCDAALLYVDPVAALVLPKPLFGLGVQESKKPKSRHCWVKALAWDHHGDYLVGATGLGFLFVAPRLCSPSAAHAAGCDLDFGPTLYLPLLPLLVSSHQGKVTTNQLYSVLCHPHRSLIFLSDGFSITSLRLPALAPDAAPRAALAAIFAAIAEVAPPLGCGLSPRLSACQHFGEDQMARVARWTATQSSLGEEVEAFRRLEECLDAADAEEADAEAEADSNPDLSVPAAPWVAPTLAVPPPEYSDSGWQSHFGDDPDAWLRRCRHLFADAFGHLLTAPGVALGGEQRQLLADGALEAAHRVMVALLASLDEVEDDNREEGVLETLRQVGDLLRLVLHLAGLDAMAQCCLAPLARFVEACAELMALGREPSPLSDHCSLPYRLAMAHRLSADAAARLSEIYGLCRGGGDGGWLPRVLAPHVAAQRSKEASPAVLKSLLKLNRRLLRAFRQLAAKIDGDEGLLTIIADLEAKLRVGNGGGGGIVSEALGPPKLPKVGRAERHLLAGRDDAAMQGWRDQLAKLGQQDGKLFLKKGTRCLHSILYLTILHGDLQVAVQLISLISYTCESQPWDDFRYLEPFRETFDDKVALFEMRRSAVLRTMARWMAAYFANLPIFIFPPHTAMPMPPIQKFEEETNECRRLPLKHKTVAKLIRQHSLDAAFNADQCLEWLLLSGLMDEAAWFANRLGDWRCAVVLAWSCEFATAEQKVHPKRVRANCHLEPSLTPSAQLLSHARALIDRLLSDDDVMERARDDGLVRGFRDLFTAACVAGCPLLAPLVADLLSRLRALIQQLDLFVPADLYLPAPPLFCPQTPPETRRQAAPSGKEARLRFGIWRCFDLAFSLLRAGHAALPCAGWYAQQLLNAHERGADLARFAPPPSEEAWEERLDEWANDFVPFGECLYQEANLSDPAGCDATRLLGHFRDLCALAWRLQVRDKLSALMRQRTEAAQHCSGPDEAWLELNFDCLVWIQHCLPFSRLLPAVQAAELHHALLSVLLEFEPEPALADVLITWDLTPASERLSACFVERLEDLLDEWKEKYLEGGERRSVLTKHRRRGRRGSRQLVQRGATMSSHFYSRAASRDEEHQVWADTFGEMEQFVTFDREASSLQVGARFCEVEFAYLDFVSMLFSVGLAKALDAAADMGGPEQAQPSPLLLAFSGTVREKVLRDVTGGGSLPTSPRSPRPPLPSPRYQRSLSIGAVRSQQRPLSARSSKTAPYSGAPAPDRRSRANSAPRRHRSSSVCSMRLDAPPDAAPAPVPALNLADLTPKRPSSNFGGRRASLSDIRGGMAPAPDAFLFTPRAGGGGKGSGGGGMSVASAARSSVPAPIVYPLDFDLPPFRSELFERLTWLVRWSWRQPGNSICRQGASASIRLRLNASVILYAAFGVQQEPTSRRAPPAPVRTPRQAPPHSVPQPPPPPPPAPKALKAARPPLERQSSRESLFSEESSAVSSGGYSNRLRSAARRHFAEFLAENQHSSASKNGSAPSEAAPDEDETLAESMSDMDNDALRFSVDLGKCMTLQSNNSALKAPRSLVEQPSSSMAISSLTALPFGVSTFHLASANSTGDAVTALPMATASPALFNESEVRPKTASPVASLPPPVPTSAASRLSPSEGAKSVTPGSCSPVPRDKSPTASCNAMSGSAAAALPQQVQQVFREEFRRIMAIQQAGFSAMLTALDGNESPPSTTRRGRHRRVREEEEEEEEEEWEEEPRPRRGRKKNSGRRRSARNGHREPLSPPSDFTEVTDLASNFDLTPKTPPSRRGRRQAMEEAVEEEEEEMHAEISRQFGPSVRSALSELNDLRSQQQRPAPKFRAPAAPEKENGPAGFPLLRIRPEEGPNSPSSTGAPSARLQLPFPLLTVGAPAAAAPVAPPPGPPLLVPPPDAPFPLLRLPGTARPFLVPPAPRQAKPSMPPPHVVANFIRERRAQELAHRRPLKVADPSLVEEGLRARLSVPPLLSAPPFGAFPTPRDSARSRSARTFSEEKDPEVEEEEEEEEEEEKKPESARKPRRATSKSPRRPPALDVGTVMVTDAGTQHDALDEEDEQLVYQGYAITPGIFELPAECADAEVMTSARPAVDTAAMTSPRESPRVAVVPSPAVRAAESQTDFISALRLGAVVQLDDKQVPILPPDILGNIRLDDQTGGDRKFLSVVSVDHGLWDELVGREMAKIVDDEVKALEKPPDLQKLRHLNRRALAASQDAGPDPLTQRILSSRPEGEDVDEGENNAAEYRHESRSKLKATMTRTLIDMEARFRDINAMHNKMEREYPNLQNLLDDVEALDTEARQRYPFLAPESSPRKGQKKTPRSAETSEPRVTIVEDRREPGPASPADDLDLALSDPPAPPTPHAAPPPAAASTARSREAELLRLADVVAVDEVLDTGRSRRRSPPRSDRPEAPPAEKDPAERERLREWLSERRGRQLAEYRQQRQARVAAEVQPFSGGRAEAAEAPKALRRSREVMARAMAEEREAEARRMATAAIAGLGLPPAKNASVPGPARVRRKVSGERRTGRKEPAADEDEFKTYEEYDEYLDHMMELSSAATSEILKGRGAPPQPPQPPPPEMAEYRAPRRKAFTETVRLQRPEVTRKAASRRPMNRDEMFASLKEVKGLVPKSSPAARSARSSGPTDRRSTGGPIRRAGPASERPKSYTPGSRPARQISRDAARPSVRQQPYQPPAARSLDDEMTSILSDWSMSDDVKRILYGGNGAADGNRLNRTLDDVNSQGLDYNSEQSDSVASYIDWDKIDELVQNA